MHISKPELLRVGKSDECGCPEEEWDINGVFTTIHLDGDGSAGIFVSGDSWEDEKLVTCNNMPDLRRLAQEWIYSLQAEAAQQGGGDS